jgi:hypothetical protein
VILVLTVLAGILLPIILRARKSMANARVQLDLNTLSVGLAAYNADFKDYPRTTPLDPTPDRGARLLARALIGPADKAIDGADGTGFRSVVPGKVYGPYVQPDKFRLSATDDTATILIDRSGTMKPVLYFPASKAKPDISLAGRYVASGVPPTPEPMYDADDNLAAFQHAASDTNPLMAQRVQAMFGDYNFNGGINAGETAATTAPFVLWEAGLDGKFGPEVPDKAGVNKCDDVITFTFGN